MDSVWKILTEGGAPWHSASRVLLIDRWPYMRVYDEEVHVPDGRVIPNWTHVELPPFVIMFAVMEDGRVPFVRQYRQAAQTWLLELPAGHANDGEDMVEAAKREMLEESGIVADSWQFMGKYIMDANRGCGWAYLYMAQDARQIAEPDHGDLGEMTLHLLPLDEVRSAFEAGLFISGPTSMAIGIGLSVLSSPKAK